MLKGYKTYIICVLALITLGLTQYGIIPAGSLDVILGILGVGAVASLRSAISKV